MGSGPATLASSLPLAAIHRLFIFLLLHKHLMSACCVLGAIADSGNAATNKAEASQLTYDLLSPWDVSFIIDSVSYAAHPRHLEQCLAYGGKSRRKCWKNGQRCEGPSGEHVDDRRWATGRVWLWKVGLLHSNVV